MAKVSAAVIGSGFGGLALAIRLQAAGCRTVIFEKRDQPGGRAYVYRDQGFTFDAGPTVITAPDCLRELFTLAGKSMADYVTLLPVHPFYRLLWEDGFSFDYSADVASVERQIVSKAPADLHGYRSFLTFSERVFEEGYVKLAHVPFLNWSSMVKVAPQLLRLKAYRSVYSIVAIFIQDPHLRQLFSFHPLLVGGNPFTTTSIYTLIHCLERKWGVFFPKGGTGALVQALLKLFQELGGRVRLESEVSEILTRGNRVVGVQTQTGERHELDLVASNGDVFHTYDRLLRNEPKAGRMRRRLAGMSYSMSLFLIYFGTRRQYPNLKHHNIIFGPRYRELLKDIFGRGRLADDFSLYLHAPTRSDPSLAPPGCESFYVLSPVPHLGKLSVDWSVEGPRYADRILGYLEEHYIPNLRNEIVSQRFFTPQDFKTELNAYLGSAFSLEPRLMQSAYFRVQNRDANLRGLYLVGAGTHPGAGIPGVVNSAKATAGLILDDIEKAVVVRSAKEVQDYPMSEAMSPRVKAALNECRWMITQGSKSFSLAARLFDSDTRDAAFFLYGWCRYCDDQVDQAGMEESREQLEQRLATLSEATRSVFSGAAQEQAVFIAMQYIVQRYSIPAHYALELIEGMAMDARGTRYRTFNDLSLYCYRVAGTVGLMMSHVMGLRDEQALKHAADLGIAMQLTNIARDITEDASMGRIYLPLEWVEGAGIAPEEIAAEKNRHKLALITARLLKEAERHYLSGDAGLWHLSFRSACAVAAARHVYAEIGSLLLQKGSSAWDQRSYVTGARKLWVILGGVLQVIASIPARLLRPWSAAPIHMIWRHSQL